MPMRILLAPMGTDGDLRPIAALSQALLERGHHMVAAIPANASGFFAGRCTDEFIYGTRTDELIGNNDRLGNGRPLHTLLEMMRLLPIALREQSEAMAKCVPGVDLVIGSGLQFCASFEAERLGIRYLHVAHVPQVLPSTEHPPFFLPWQNLGPALNRILWGLNNFNTSLWAGIYFNRVRRSMGLPGLWDYAGYYTRDLLIAIDPELARIPSDAPGRCTQVAYWPFDDGTPLSPDLSRFLEAGEPPVYVGFGSMGSRDPGNLVRVILESLQALGVRTILHAGWAGLGLDEMPESLRRSTFLCGKVSHKLLFPRVSLVVHHGGAGTTRSAAAAGVPQVIVPHLLDQFYWAEKMRRLGLAPTAVSRAGISAGKLGRAVQSVLEDPGYAERSQAMARRLVRNDGIGDAVRFIEGVGSAPTRTLRA